MLSGNWAGFLHDCTFFPHVYCHTRMRQLLPGTVSDEEGERSANGSLQSVSQPSQNVFKGFPRSFTWPLLLNYHYPNSITGLFPDQSLGGSKKELGGACGSSVTLPYSELSIQSGETRVPVPGHLMGYITWCQDVLGGDIRDKPGLSEQSNVDVSYLTFRTATIQGLDRCYIPLT